MFREKQKILSILFLFIPGSLVPYTIYGQGLQQVVLQIENETFTDQTFFLFAEGGKIGSDVYDALKLSSLSSTFGEIYSQDTASTNLSIHTLPDKLEEVLKIPVFIRSTISDTFKVTVPKFENIQSNWTISLVNLNTNDTLSLNKTVSVDVIHSGAFQSGVLTIQHFTVIIDPGIVTQESSITGTAGKNGWRFLGSPFSNISFARLLDSVWTQGAISSDDPTGTPNIFTWSESAQTFEAVSDLDAVPDTGMGFITFMYEDDDPSNPGVDGGWPKSFHTSGVAGFGSVNFPVAYTSGADTSLNGFNLVANPYPFSIDWNASSGWSRSNVQDAVWIWDPNANSGNGDYLEHALGVGDPINVIAPNQAFWVRAKNANPQLIADESVKVSGGSFLKSYNPIPSLKLKVRSKESDFEDALYLSFREYELEPTQSFDMAKLSPLSQNYLSVYAFSEGEKLAIKNLPNDFTRLEIPILLDHSMAGEFTLTLEGLNFDYEYTEIQIFDEVHNHLIEIDALNDEYPFYSDSGAYAFTLMLEKGVSTSNDIEAGVPARTQLFQNYPNPFNPETTINYHVPLQSSVRLEVFDMLGRKVASLVNNERQSAGRYSVRFNASKLSGGVYIYRLQVGNNILSKKFTLVK